MKRLKMKKIHFLYIALLWMFSGCDKNFEEINTDTTKLTQENMQYNYLFTSAELFTPGNGDGYSAGTWESSLSYASTMMQQLSSTSGYWYGDKYIFNDGYNSAFWRYQYSTSIKSIVDLLNNLKDQPQKANLFHIARVLKVYLFQRMTDVYGDVPYADAGQGYAEGITSPSYTKQQDIYEAMLGELDDAAQLLDEAAPNTVGDADLFYGGDVVKWKKFAYSEMLRLGMRMSKVNPDNAKTWVQKAVTGGVMESNDDNAICPHEAKGTNRVSNPVGLQLDAREPASYRLSETFVNFLKQNSDPRLAFLATVVADPTDVEDKGDMDTAIQLGQPNGYDHSGTATDIENAANWPGDQNAYSTVNRNVFSREDAPTFVLTYAETELLLAEAAERGWITDDPATHYNNGVSAAILQLNQAGATLTDQDAADYISSHPYDPANGLQMINEQYWVATFADWLETWSNWRRSGFPVLVPVVYQGNATGGTIPRRFTYPLDEASVNPVNYSAAVSTIPGGDNMSSRVWWDK